MSDLLDSLVPVQIDEINREPHSECVYGLTGNDPQSLPGTKFLAAEKTFSPLLITICNVYAASKLNLPGHIRDAEPHGRLDCAASGDETSDSLSNTHGDTSIRH